MLLNGKTMAAVAMMVGLLGATGCNALNSASSEPIAPEENAASAPVENENGAEASATPGVENYHYYGRTRYYAPHAPPAVRYERVGRAPSARHFWVKGTGRTTAASGCGSVATGTCSARATPTSPRTGTSCTAGTSSCVATGCTADRSIQ